MKNLMSRSFLAVCVFLGFMVYAAYNSLRHNTSLPVDREDNPTAQDMLFYNTVGGSPESTPAPQSESSMDGYVVELQTVFSREEAEATVSDLNTRGLEAYYSPYRFKGRVYFRIRCGFVGSESEALAKSKEILDVYKLKSKVVRL